MKFRHVLLGLVCSTAFVFYAESALAATAGHIQFVNGDVRVINPSGITHVLQKGDAINEGDTISSAKEASAQVKMEDGGFIAVRQETQLKFDSFKVALKQGDPENSFFFLVKGSFRAVTGLIGRVNKQNYKITTPVATIGIRGTDHETAFVPNALPGVPAGAYSKVNIGETSLTTDVGTINVNPNQMGFAGGVNVVPEIRPINIHLFTTTPLPIANGGGKTQSSGQSSSGTGEGEQIRDTAVVDSTSQSGGANSTAPTTATTVTTTDTTTVTTPPQTTTPVTLTDNSNPGLVLDTTNQTLTVDGSTVSVQSGTFGIEAQTAADASKTAALAAAAAASSAVADNTTLAGLTTVDTASAVVAISTASPVVSTAAALTPAPTTFASAAISSATPSVTSASTAVSAATALVVPATTPVSTTIGTATTGIATASTAVTAASALAPAAALSTADATAAQAAATAAAAKAAAAQAALTAHGTFADVTAAPANTATQAANTALQAANTIVQSAPTTVVSQNSALTSAQAAAAAALNTATSNLAAANSNLATATTQNSALTSAQAAAAAALSTATSNLATANSNLATATTQNSALTAAQLAAQNALTTANTSLTAATNQNTAIATAQSSAATQLATAQAAATAAQAAATAAQTAADQAKTAQTLGDFTGAQAKLTEAKAQLTEAQNQQAAAAAALAVLSSQLTTAQTAQSSGVASVTSAVTAATTAQTQAAAAQSALTAANTAATTAATAATTAASAATTAQTQAATAQTALTAANTTLTAATTAANTAATSATTASTQAAAAQTASTTANAAATASSTNLTTVNTNAPIVANNYLVAQYNNPAVAGNFIGATMLSVPASGGGFNAAFPPDSLPQLNTAYVLDGGGNLVEMRNSQFRVQANQNGGWLTPNIIGTSGADIKWSGGTGADVFNLPDNSIYLGRWVGATVTVTDNATPTNVYTYTPADNIWLVALPPPTGYTQTLIGTTTYTKAGNTTPVDAFGNFGVLNSASLSANFTSQLVTVGVNLTMGAASPMGGTYAVTGANLPINGGGFDIYSGSSHPGTLTISCSGTCAATGTTGYSAELGGGFAGTAAASAAMSYSIWPTTAATSSVTDAVQGFVAFTTATPPTSPGVALAAYAGGNVAIEYATGPGINTSSGSSMVVPPAALSLPVNNSGSGTQTATIYQAPSQDNGGYTFTDTFTVTNPTAVTTVASSGIQFGANSYSSFSQTSSQPLGPNGAPSQWMVGPEGFLDTATAAANLVTASTISSPVILNYTYTSNDGIAPVDSSTKSGSVIGTLTSATLSANLTSMTVDASLNIHMNVGATGNNYVETSTGMGLFFGNGGNSANRNQFGGGATVTSSSCGSSGCNGSINGALTGPNFSGAMLAYNLSDSNAGLNNTNGTAAFAVQSSPLPTGTGSTGNYTVIAGGGGGGSYVSLASNRVLDTNGVLIGFSAGTTGNGYTTTIACTACNGPPATNNATTGISYGTWDSGTIANTFSGTNVSNPSKLFWITGPEVIPTYLPQVLTTIATYSFANGAVGDFTGNTGAISSTSSLTANFSNQTVGVNLLGTIGNGTSSLAWSASTASSYPAVLGGNCGSSNACFSANTFGQQPNQPGYLTVVVDGNSSVTNPSSVNGQVSGQLAGNGLNGAILSFNLNANNISTVLNPYGENLQGVAAFTGPAQDTLTPYKIAIAMVNDTTVTKGDDPMIGGYQAAGNVVLSGGNLTEFNDANNSGSDTKHITLSSGTQSVLPSAFTGTSTGSGIACNPCTDVVTGIQWGRWATVTANATDLVDGQVKAPLSIAGGGLHWIATPTLTGPVTMPMSGNATYIVSGGTNPTDTSGAIGSLASATLAANFTAQTVDVGVHAIVPTADITASAVNVPISQRATFRSDTSIGTSTTGLLAVNCTGAACSTNPAAPAQAEILGGFGGAGALGAVMMYGFLPNPAAANMITGVVAFHR